MAATSVTEHFDRLVVANGIFCEPAVPRYPGVAEFTAAGGRVIAGTELHDAEQARGKHVLVVGYGKSACDVTVPLSQVAADTDVIARHLLWKVPRRIGGVLNFKMLLLTRMGEALFKYRTRRGVEKFLHGPGKKSARQHDQLDRLGLGPPVRAQAARPGPPGAHGGHRPRGDRPGHRGLLRGRRRRADQRAGEPHHRPAAVGGRRADGGARRRHPAAGRPDRLRDRVRAERAVPARRGDRPAARRAGQLPALPADPPGRRARACT